jgi:hypothetical protein
MSEDQLTVIQDIPFNGGTVYAYRVGDSISREAVEANKWQDYVAAPTTKAAKEAVASSAPQTSTTAKG